MFKKLLFLVLAGACVIALGLLLFPQGAQRTKSLEQKAQGDKSVRPTLPPPATNPGLPSVTENRDIEWNTYHRNSPLTGAIDISAPVPLQQKWSVLTGAPIEHPPVCSGGRIFVVTSKAEVLAVSLEGSILWRTMISKKTTPTGTARVYIDAPMAVFRNTLFVCDDTGTIHALEGHTGRVLWQTHTDAVFKGTPNYQERTGRLYLLDQGTGRVLCVDSASGELLWRSEEVDRADGSLAVLEDKVVYGSCAAALHVRSAHDGHFISDIMIEDGGGQIAGGIALVDRYAYGGCRDGRVFCADITQGTLAWIRSVGEDEVFTTPAVWSGNVVTASLDGMVHAFEASTGDIIWQAEAEASPTSPIIANDRVIVAAAGKIMVFSLEQGNLVEEVRFADEITSPMVVPGLVVFGTGDGALIAAGSVDENVVSSE